MNKETLIVACAVIHNPLEDSYLMGQRAIHKHNGGLWEFMGGKKDPEDETIQVTAEREIDEEIRVKGKAGGVLKRIVRSYENGPTVDLHFIEFLIPKNAPIDPDPDVYQKVEWISKSGLLDLDLSEGDRLFAKTLFEA
jgi:8-oxo-dGTP pyrophosphatase MutT (NUDIX family)